MELGGGILEDSSGGRFNFYNIFQWNLQHIISMKSTHAYHNFVGPEKVVQELWPFSKFSYIHIEIHVDCAFNYFLSFQVI